MDILLLGAEGQLGREFKSLLNSNNLKFQTYSHNDLDITNHESVRELFKNNKLKLIINTAAYNLVDRAEDNPYLAVEVNHKAVENLALLCSKNSVFLIHFSTNYVFDGTSLEPYKINDPPNPLSVYGKSKYMGEKAILQNMDKNFLIVRTSWVFGLGPQNFIYKLLNWAKDNSTLKIVDDEIAAPTSTSDLAKATFELYSSGLSGLYHITNRGNCSRFKWAELILNEIKWTGELKPTNLSNFGLKAKRPHRAILDISELPKEIHSNLKSWEDATTIAVKRINQNQII